MRVYSIGRSYKSKKDWIVYENENEWKATGLTVKPLIDAREGDYVKSDNGFYIPVIHYYEMDRKTKYKSYFVTYVFPKYTFKTLKSVNGLKHRQLTFPLYPPKEIFFLELDKQTNWNTEDVKKLYLKLMDATHNTANSKNNVSNKYKHIAKMIKEGHSFNNAIMHVFPTTNRSKAKFREIVNHIYNNSTVLNHIVGKGIMKGLKEKLTKLGINEESIAANLKECLDSDNATLKKWAMEYVINLFEKGESNKVSVPDANEISKTISEKMKLVSGN